MAHTDDIPPNVSDSMAQQIAQRVESIKQAGAVKTLPFDANLPLRLRETLDIWTLRSDAVAPYNNSTPASDLKDWVRRTFHLHHQLKVGDEVKAYARSMYPETDLSAASLCQLSGSALAAEIDKAISAIDENLSGDTWLAEHHPVVRLLEIPAYHVDALWLFNEATQESRVLIITAPSRYDQLAHERLLTSQEFLEAFADKQLLEGTS